MSKRNSILTYLALMVLMVLIGGVITFIRGDLRPFDPKLTMGLMGLTLLAVMRSLGVMVATNAVIGFLLRRPGYVLLWIPVGTMLAVLMHHAVGARLGLMELDRIGWFDAFLMYLPSVGFLSLLGGLLGSLLKRG